MVPWVAIHLVLPGRDPLRAAVISLPGIDDITDDPTSPSPGDSIPHVHDFCWFHRWPVRLIQKSL